MLNWTRLQIQPLLSQVSNQRGQTELLLLLILIFLVLLLTSSGRVALQ